MLARRARRGMKFTFRYTGLRAKDLDATVRFFTEGLGMRVVERGEVAETGGKLVLLESEGHPHRLELNWYPPGSRFDAPFVAGEALDHLYFEMERGAKLEAALAQLTKAGGKVRIEPFAEGGGRRAYVDSPDGHTVELYERAG